MAYVPFATEFNIKYTLTGPAPMSAVSVLNDPTDPNYSGMLKEITGLDSAEVRESANERVESDGGEHGRFYFGRRPITMTVSVHSHETALERAQKIDRLHRAAQGLRTDSVLSWAPSYAPTVGMYVPVRLQQPIRDTGAWAKEVLVSLVSEKPVIQSQVEYVSGSVSSGAGSVAVENMGSYVSFPLVEISGASTNPTVTSWSAPSGGVITGAVNTTGLTLSIGETIQIDTLNHSAVFTAGPRAGQSGNQYINFTTTVIWPHLLAASTSAITLSGGGSAVAKWRDAWH
jgi:hypothetical protein